jgi:hypothetical protein
MNVTLNIDSKNLEKYAKALFKENVELRQKIIELEDKVEHLETLLTNLPVLEVKRDK